MKGHSRHFKPFIANRIGELLPATSPERWRYVPTKENPADYLTRGATLTELAKLKGWREGPAFLSDSQDDWPPLGMVSSPTENQRKLKKSMAQVSNQSSLTFTTVSNLGKEECWRLQPERFSSWRRLTRVTALTF